MHAFSSNSDCLATRPKQEHLWQDMMRNLPILTSIQGGARYPVLLGLRCRSVDLYFLRYFEESVEATASVFAACMSAYQPEQVTLSYMVESMPQMGAVPPPYVLFFHGTNAPMVNLIITKCEWVEEYYKLSRAVGKVVDPNAIQRMDFQFKDALFHFFGDISDQRSAGEDALRRWRPEVRWGFDDVRMGRLPPSA